LLAQAVEMEAEVRTCVYRKLKPAHNGDEVRSGSGVKR
jgi:hypothetical protein